MLPSSTRHTDETCETVACRIKGMECDKHAAPRSPSLLQQLLIVVSTHHIGRTVHTILIKADLVSLGFNHNGGARTDDKVGPRPLPDAVQCDLARSARHRGYLGVIDSIDHTSAEMIEKMIARVCPLYHLPSSSCFLK